MTARRVAVFVAHGMGQQVPFETLDQVAQGLIGQNEKAAGGSPPHDGFSAKAVKFEEQWLNRIELQLGGGSASPGAAVETHVYEGYWAPLTEGKISARGVISFLIGAGRNGVRVGGDFRRWVFGTFWRIDTPIRVVFYLLVLLLMLVSLVAMNSTIAVVAATRGLLAQKPAWLSVGLFLDLTTTFNVLIAAIAVFGISLGVALGLRELRVPPGVRRAWGLVTVLAFAGVLFLVILAALSLALLFYGHVKLQAPGSAEVELWPMILPGIEGLNQAFDDWAMRLVILAAAGFLLWWLLKIARGVVRDLGKASERWPTLIATGGAAVLVVLAAWLGLAFAEVFGGLGNGAMDVVEGGVSWALLVAVSGFVRKLVVQYVGDVAIYVAPYGLDSFFQLRYQIKESVYKVARAVYALRRQDDTGPEYDQVFIVGHSLGSVVVYDTLNRLINEDEASGRSLKVVERTPMLLTFGSPLDKSAFLFAIQGDKTDEAREALAATNQPLILDYRFRPDRWVNIYSPWDVFSGSLGFYDCPRDSHPTKQVENIVDPEATTLLAAHVEYWTNPLLFATLYGAIVGGSGSGAAVVVPPQ